MHILRGFIGLTCMIIIAWLLSRDRRNVNWRLVLIGVGIQVGIGALLQIDILAEGMNMVASGFRTVTDFGIKGAEFVFGGQLTAADGPAGFVFAFRVLPIIIFFAALTSALYYAGVLQIFVKAFAWVMARTMRLSGAESISAAGNVFLGQTEAPLLVKPYIAGMTRSEIMCLMTGGMATIAGSVLAAYISLLGGGDEAKEIMYANHLITASLMNAPAAIVMAKILVPEKKDHLLKNDLSVSSEKLGANFIDAISNGTSEGLKLAANVGAMLIAFIALIFLVNGFLGWIGDITSLNGWIAESTKIAGTELSAFDGLSLQYIVGQIFRFLAWAIGIEWQDTLVVGSMVGTKVVVNEFVAYLALVDFSDNAVISERSQVITAYALCGFANFSSIAIQIGGIGAIAPNQRVALSQLGLLSVAGGMLASMMTASVAGMWTPNYGKLEGKVYEISAPCRVDKHTSHCLISTGKDQVHLYKSGGDEILVSAKVDSLGNFNLISEPGTFVVKAWSAIDSSETVVDTVNFSGGEVLWREYQY